MCLFSLIMRKILYAYYAYAKNIGTDQAAHTHIMISTFVVLCLDSFIHFISIPEFQASSRVLYLSRRVCMLLLKYVFSYSQSAHVVCAMLLDFPLRVFSYCYVIATQPVRFADRQSMQRSFQLSALAYFSRCSI